MAGSSEGDHIAQGDIIAEVETDKAAMEMEAFEAGTVRELRVPEGETVPVGTVIAVLSVQGEAEQKTREKEKKPAPAAKPEGETGKPRKEAASAKERGKTEPAEEEAEASEEAAEMAPEVRRPPAEKAPAGEKKAEVGAFRMTQEQIVASPAARRLAGTKGLDLTRVRGTGPGGRIVADDVEQAAVAEPPARSAAAEKETPAAFRTGGRERRKPERSVKIRRIVARKMTESWQTIPHFFVTVAVDMTDMIRIRKDLEGKYQRLHHRGRRPESAGISLGQQPLGRWRGRGAEGNQHRGGRGHRARSV